MSNALNTSTTGHQDKFEFRDGQFRAVTSLGSSFLLADLVATAYGTSLPELAHGRLLDLGCGRAPLRPVYECKTTDVVFADIESRDPSLSPFVTLDAGGDLPFDDDEFDTVVLSDVLEHVNNPMQALANIARVLRPGGVLVGNTPFLYWIHEEPYDFWRPTRYGLHHGLTEAGFTQIEITELGGSIEVVLDVLAKHSGTTPVIGAAIGGAVGRMGSRWARSSVGRRVAAKTGVKYPMAHFFVARTPSEQVGT